MQRTGGYLGLLERESLRQKLDAMDAAEMDADEANVAAETMPAAMEGLKPF